MKHMRLRLRLLLQIGVALCLLWGGVALWMQRGLQGELRATLDQRLVMAADMVANLVAANPAAWGEPRQSRPTLQVDIDNDGLACQISDLRGAVYARSNASGVGDMRVVQTGFSEHEEGGQLWRTYTLARGELLITTADRLERREHLLKQITLAASLPFLSALAGGLLLLWLGVGSGLRPLERLRETLARRDPQDLTPVDEEQLPADLLPLTHALNELLARIAGSMARERRFTADAAHELRTPLTAIKLHLQLLELSQGAAAQTALAHANEGVARLQQVLSQLLTLAEVDTPAEATPTPATPLLRVIELARRDCPGMAADQLQLWLPEDAQTLQLAVPEALAVTALRNLLDNAARHAPPQTLVELHVSADAQQLQLMLSDRGPGMGEQDLAHATERFWRRAQGPGSGLGLSIVKAVAERYGGSFSLLARAGGGLQARLEFPRAAC